MEIQKTHHIEKGEQDSEGFYNYYYEYDLCRFTEGELCYVVRSYSDEPTKASFLRKEINGIMESVTQADLSNPLFQAAFSYLQNEGKTHIDYFDSLYRRILDNP